MHSFPKPNPNHNPKKLRQLSSILTLSTLMCDNIAPHVQLFLAQRSKIVFKIQWYSCIL